jgi:hypothetical protein
MLIHFTLHGADYEMEREVDGTHYFERLVKVEDVKAFAAWLDTIWARDRVTAGWVMRHEVEREAEEQWRHR